MLLAGWQLPHGDTPSPGLKSGLSSQGLWEIFTECAAVLHGPGAAGKACGTRVPVGPPVSPVLGTPVSLACSKMLPSVLILLGAHSCPKTPCQGLWASNRSLRLSSASRRVPALLLLLMDWEKPVHVWGGHRGQAGGGTDYSLCRPRLCLHSSLDALQPFVLIAKSLLAEIVLPSP